MGKLARNTKNKRSDDLVVKILAEADIAGVMATAEKFNISFRTIYNYYERLALDPNLSLMYLEHKKMLANRWADELAETVIAGAKISKAMINDPNCDLVRLNVIVNATKTFAEIMVANQAIGGGAIDIEATSTYYEID